MGRSARMDGAAALLLVVLSLALRLPRLAETPGWDGDEGYNLEIAWRLLHGEARYFALSQSFVQHPVLFYALLAPLLGAFGRDLLVARALVAVATSLAVGVTYLALRDATGRRAASLAGLTLAVAHFVVLHGRLAYTYNLLLLWSAIALWCITEWERHRERPWLLGAIVAAALGLLTDQVGIALPLFVALRLLPRRRLALFACAASLLPALLAAVAMLVLQPNAAIQDWGKALGRVSVETPGLSGGGAVRLALWFVNYFHLLRAEWWLPVGVAGLFCVGNVRSRRRLLALGALSALPIFALRDLDPFFRTGISLLLPIAAGCGALLDTGFRLLRETLPAPPARVAVTALILAFPMGLELARSAGAAATEFKTRMDWALVSDRDGARRAASYVRSERRAGDIVLVSPHVSWLYDGPTADFFQAVAVTGAEIAFYPAALDRDRFAFEPSVGNARFVVVDPFWYRWAEASPDVLGLLARVEAWPEVLRVGSFSVRRNPSAG